MARNECQKIAWQGEILSVQPRFRLIRSFNERSHMYLGYALHVCGEFDGFPGAAWVGIGKAAQAKHRFRTGMTASGKAWTVPDPRLEPVDLYRASALKGEPGGSASANPPPWQGCPPAIEVYRERRHRRLDPRTYAAKCVTCIWGARMPVEIIIDHWNPDIREYRFETFCYGPKSCKFYKAGRIRTVPGRKGIIWEEEDWIDEEETAHRGPDD
jgi:hypothetical protein